MYKHEYNQSESDIIYNTMRTTRSIKIDFIEVPLPMWSDLIIVLL